MHRTPFYGFHTQLGAKMVDFAGWEMPLLYRGIVEEHLHTRRVGSVFDVSHMGRLRLTGSAAEALLQRVCTRQLGDMASGQCRYSHVCNESGGILDDVIVSRYADRWLCVCNASNREKIVSWLRRHGEGKDVAIDDTTESTAMIAVQGPAAIESLSGFLPVGELKRYHCLSGEIMGMSYACSRTGYTGEDGIELILPGPMADLAAGALSSLGTEERPLEPAGLGARDTLRLEAGMPLYGHELHEQVDPISAGQGWCVDLRKDFIGSEALRRIAETGPQRKLVGLELEGRRIARPAAAVLDGEAGVGEVTSGTFGPTLERSVAMAYVPAAAAEPGRTLEVDLGGRRAGAVVVKLPFYKRPRA